MKIKAFLSIIFLACFGISAYSQDVSTNIPFDGKKTATLDSAEYKVMYKLDFERDLSKREGRLKNDLALLVGKKHSKSFNASYLPKAETRKAPPGTGFNIEGRGLAATEVFRNKNSGKMTVTTRMRDRKTYRYTEDFPKQNWTILNKQKKIQGYNCQAAKTRFLGREYTAWFTKEIRLQEGPWKFGGLPGLILEVADTQRQFVFSFVSFEKLNKKIPIVEYQTEYTLMPRKKLNERIEYIHNNFGKVVESIGGHLEMFTPEGKKIDVSKLKYPYNPIELE